MLSLQGLTTLLKPAYEVPVVTLPPTFIQRGRDSGFE
jgi:hypothetical protein